MLFKGQFPFGLFGRSLLIIVTPLVIVQLVATYVFFDRHWALISRRLASAVASDIAAAIDLHERAGQMLSEPQLSAYAQSYYDLRLGFAGGDTLADAVAPRPQGFVELMLSNALAEHVQRPFELAPITNPKEILVRVQLSDGVLSTAVPLERLTSSTAALVIIWMAGVSLLTLAIAIAVMRKQTLPVLKLAMAADSFGRGIDVPEFKPEGAPEVRLAARALILMRERIGRQIAQRTEMLAGVSHDLRTPITRLKLQIAMMPAGPEADGLRADIDQMERMVNAYLTFARGEGTETPVATNLPELLEDVVEGACRQGHEVDLSLPATDPDRLTVELRRDAMKRCIENLVSNACRYGRHVQVGLRRLGRSIEITVDDDGPGIPATEREAVFRPFFRLDRSRNAATGGIGLGLAIARDVARGHGGDIELGDSPIGGLRAVIRLPV